MHDMQNVQINLQIYLHKNKQKDMLFNMYEYSEYVRMCRMICKVVCKKKLVFVFHEKSVHVFVS